MVDGIISNFIIASNKDAYELEQKENVATYEFEYAKDILLGNVVNTNFTKEYVVKYIDVFGLENNIEFKIDDGITIFNSVLNSTIKPEVSAKNIVVVDYDNDVEVVLFTSDKLYYKKVNKEEISKDITKFEELKNDYKVINVPSYINIGYITDIEKNKKYIFIRTLDTYKILVLEDGELRILDIPLF